MCVECCKSEVPPLASGPILCLLGAMMCSSVKGVDWDDFQESVRACRARHRFYIDVRCVQHRDLQGSHAVAGVP